MPTLDAGLDLLDREIVDVDGEPVGKVDDIELSDPADGPPTIVALLLGPAAFGRRIGGRLGSWIEGAGVKLAETPEPVRIPVDLIAEIDVSVHLSVSRTSLQRPNRVEDWLRERFIERIPGARRAAE